MCIDPITGLELPYTPHGRFVHVPPPNPSTKWATDFGRPWWKDPKYIVGKLSNRTRLIKITNMLSAESQTLEVRRSTYGLFMSVSFMSLECLFEWSCLDEFSFECIFECL
jgi:hypothetical protein